MRATAHNQCLLEILVDKKSMQLGCNLAEQSDDWAYCLHCS